MSVSGTMRRRITPRAWACSAAPSRSRTSACAVRIGRGPRRSASARLSPSTQLAVRYANEPTTRSEEHKSELQSQSNLVCRLLLEKKKDRNSAQQRTDYNAHREHLP